MVSGLITLIEQDYVLNGRRSFGSCVQFHWRHVTRLLGKVPIRKLTAAKIDAFKRRRLEEGAARGSVNIQLSLLRRGLRLALRLERVHRIPHVGLLATQTVREGFITCEKFREILATLQVLDRDVADLCEWLFLTGWRVGEAKGLLWSEITTEAIHIPGTRTKNCRPRNVPLVEPLREILDRRRAVRSGPNVFHRHGRPIRTFRRTWDRALKARGCEGFVPHDMRRSFARNAMLAGVNQKVSMDLGGWVTARMWFRYAIVDERLLADALRKIAALFKGP